MFLTHILRIFSLKIIVHILVIFAIYNPSPDYNIFGNCRVMIKKIKKRNTLSIIYCLRTYCLLKTIKKTQVSNFSFISR